MSLGKDVAFKNDVTGGSSGGGGGGAVDSVNGKTGSVVLTKTDIGLTNVDNTSDLNKPVSNATQTALDLKANANDVVLESDYNANTIMLATINDTPIASTSSQIRAFLNVEDGAEANNLSDLNATNLTGDGDSILHFHSSDRTRANHTGTQVVATISDYNTNLAGTLNTTAYIPTLDYHPTTKKFVEDLDVNVIHKNVANEFSTIAEKTAPINNDKILMEDTEDSNNKAVVKMENLPISIATQTELDKIESNAIAYAIAL